jgi:hypothetical protein
MTEEADERLLIYPVYSCLDYRLPKEDLHL